MIPRTPDSDNPKYRAASAMVSLSPAPLATAPEATSIGLEHGLQASQEVADLPVSLREPVDLVEQRQHRLTVLLSSRRTAQRHDERVYDGDMCPSNDRLGRLPASDGHERTRTHVLSVAPMRYGRT